MWDNRKTRAGATCSRSMPTPVWEPMVRARNSDCGDVDEGCTGMDYTFIEFDSALFQQRLRLCCMADGVEHYALGNEDCDDALAAAIVAVSFPDRRFKAGLGLSVKFHEDHAPCFVFIWNVWMSKPSIVANEARRVRLLIAHMIMWVDIGIEPAILNVDDSSPTIKSVLHRIERSAGGGSAVRRFQPSRGFWLPKPIASSGNSFPARWVIPPSRA